MTRKGMLSGANGCNVSHCPDPEEPNVEYVCGEYRFCGDVKLHYITPIGNYSLLKKVGDDYCEVGGIPLGSSNCDDPIYFNDKTHYIIQWCVKVDSELPYFNTSPIDGYKAYYQLFRGIHTPDTECFNSFTVCIPSCCQVRIETDKLPPIELPKMEQPYCQSFGQFDELINEIKIITSSDCISKVSLAVQRSKYGEPPKIMLPPDYPSVPCGSSNNSEIKDPEIVCFRRTDDSPIETGFVIIKVSDTGISTVIYDSNNNMVNQYSIVECC